MKVQKISTVCTHGWCVEKDFITAGEKKKKTPDVGCSQDLNLSSEPQADALSKRITGVLALTRG